MKRKIVTIILVLIFIFVITGCSNQYDKVIGEYVGVTSLDSSGEFRDSSATSLTINKDGSFTFKLSENYILSGKLEFDEESTEIEKSFKLVDLDKDDASGYIYTYYEDDKWSIPYIILITEKNQYIFSFKEK